jgi:hypothetical protein
MRPQSHSSFLNQTAPPDFHSSVSPTISARGISSIGVAACIGPAPGLPAVNPLWLTGANPVTASPAPQPKRGGWPVTSSTDIHGSPFGSTSAPGALGRRGRFHLSGSPGRRKDGFEISGGDCDMTNGIYHLARQPMPASFMARLRPVAPLSGQGHKQKIHVVSTCPPSERHIPHVVLFLASARSLLAPADMTSRFSGRNSDRTGTLPSREDQGTMSGRLKGTESGGGL